MRKIRGGLEIPLLYCEPSRQQNMSAGAGQEAPAKGISLRSGLYQKWPVPGMAGRDRKE